MQGESQSASSVKNGQTPAQGACCVRLVKSCPSAPSPLAEMIDKLTLTFNRTRQAVITKELIEIISGAAAL